MPASYLAGSRRAQIRVSVNDGFSERTAVSRPFTAPGTPPRAQIVTPQNGAVLLAGERALLTGSAFDDLDRKIGGKSLTWFAGRTRLGTGATLRRVLPAGTRRLKLAARDRNGRTSSATARVRMPRPRLRLVDVRMPAKVGRKAKAMTVRIRTSAPATLVAGGRRYRLHPRATKLTIRLPRRPATGIVEVPFRLKPSGGRAAGTIKGTFSTVRT